MPLRREGVSINMSDIQCSNITSSKRSKKRYKVEKTKIQIENNKQAILQLVKRNLQKMCLSKSSLPPAEAVPVVPLRVNRGGHAEASPGGVAAARETPRGVSTVLFDAGDVQYDYDRSKCTKELLRKAILERRRCLQDIKQDFHIEFRQKIWRPW